MIERTTLRPLEITSTFTPLGIRFWDPARDMQVYDGLRVTARPSGEPDLVTSAFRTAEGVYAFRNLPGLRDLEYATGEPVLPRRFVIEVTDLQQRFLRVAFQVDLPLPYRGLYLTDAPGSPVDSNPPGFYLFSAPTRTATSEFAVVRAHLVDHSTRQPAAHARLEVEVQEDETWYGLADERGVVTILYPYPMFLSTLHGSPPVSDPIPLNQQRWSLTIRVRYEPGTLAPISGTPVPDLAGIVRQAPGLLWPTVDGPPVMELPATLIYRQAVVLATEGLPAEEAATLLVSPGASPP